MRLTFFFYSKVFFVFTERLMNNLLINMSGRLRRNCLKLLIILNLKSSFNLYFATKNLYATLILYFYFIFVHF
ncbi:unnamed protein product [Meloidogyne enterolobii]|uniref:Uncharacterized protein n=1 Tax=Meloidogyne enterolobii TaxID=390850 RepID=A0ACB1ABS6_MELEN